MWMPTQLPAKGFNASAVAGLPTPLARPDRRVRRRRAPAGRGGTGREVEPVETALAVTELDRLCTPIVELNRRRLGDAARRIVEVVAPLQREPERRRRRGSTTDGEPARSARGEGDTGGEQCRAQQSRRSREEIPQFGQSRLNSIGRRKATRAVGACLAPSSSGGTAASINLRVHPQLDA